MREPKQVSPCALKAHLFAAGVIYASDQYLAVLEGAPLNYSAGSFVLRAGSVDAEDIEGERLLTKAEIAESIETITRLRHVRDYETARVAAARTAEARSAAYQPEAWRRAVGVLKQDKEDRT